jgi:LPS export ABC transporter protein LptC
MSSYRNLVIIVLLLLLVGGGLAIWNADRKLSHTPEASQTQQSEDDTPSMVGKNATFTVTEGETKKWKLTAAKATYNETSTEADLAEVTGEFYNKDGKPVLQFTAPKGHYTNKNNAVTLTGGVVAKSTQQVGQGGKGGELKAPKMIWDAKTNHVTASGGIELTFPQGKSTAQVCRFTLDFSNISLEGGVNSSIIAQ